MLPENVTQRACYRYLGQRRNREGKPAPVAARHEVSLLGHVFGKAIRWGVCSVNPVRGMELGGRSAKRPRVTMDQVNAARALAPERIRIAIDLAVITGQRRADLLSLTRAQLTDDGILFRRSKTETEVTIEWSDDLRSILERSKRVSPQIPGEHPIRQRNGKRYTRRGFSAIWQRLMAKHVKAAGQRFSFHDLRSVSADGAKTLEEARDRLGHVSTEAAMQHYRRAPIKVKPRS